MIDPVGKSTDTTGGDMSSDLTFENAWRGPDGCSLRFKERLILAMEEIFMCVDANDGVSLSDLACITERWCKDQNMEDANYMMNDLVAFVEACSTEGK